MKVSLFNLLNSLAVWGREDRAGGRVQKGGGRKERKGKRGKAYGCHFLSEVGMSQCKYFCDHNETF